MVRGKLHLLKEGTEIMTSFVGFGTHNLMVLINLIRKVVLLMLSIIIFILVMIQDPILAKIWMQNIREYGLRI